MTGRTFVSRFSPNRTDPAVLEAIFVQRHKLAARWYERLRDSALTEVKHHLLAVGPRGCGKSHLVALLVGRLRNDPAVSERVRIAWLPEDETTTSFWKFLLRILRALNGEYADEFPTPPHDQLAGAANDRRAAVLTEYILKKLNGRTLVVVVENLDDVMRGLKAEGQKRWRAFLQEHPVAATLATAQRLTKDVAGRERPFFNFFQIEHLQPLSSDEALSLLRKIAEHINNASLASFLDTPTGRARVRAIRHITGGSHRVFIILSEFATREKLDDLVTAFEELLDDLTPYYQERLRWLPDQQREIVEFLCRQTRTVQVKEIAAELFLSEPAAAAQLKSLRDKGYVTSASVGRESRYELAEPLMRLCVEVKDPQREPIRLIVEFLRVWYDRAGLEARLQCLPEDADLERRFYQAALQPQRPGVPGPLDEALDQDLAAARATGNPEEVVRVLIELAATADSCERCLDVASELSDLGRNMDALAACDRVIEHNSESAGAWRLKGYLLNDVDQYADGLAACDRAIELGPDDDSAWHNKGYSLNSLGRYAEALAAYDRAVELKPGNAILWNSKGNTLKELGRHEEALAAFDRAIELEPEAASTWDRKGDTLSDLGRHLEAVAAYDRAIELAPDFAFPWIGKGYLLGSIGQHKESLAAFDRSIELEPRYAFAWTGKGGALRDLGRHDEALSAYDRAIELNPDFAIAWDCKGDTLSDLARYTEALAAYDRALELEPEYAFAWNDRGRVLNELGRHEEALAAYERAIQLNPEHRVAWNNKAWTLGELRRYAEAVSACDRAIELSPKNTSVWTNRGLARVCVGQIGAAVDDFRRAIKLNGNYAQAFEGLAAAQILQGNWDEAETVLSERFRLPLSPTNHAKSGRLPDLLATIFRASSDSKVWEFRVNRLAEMASNAQTESKQTKAQEREKLTPSSADTAQRTAVPNPLTMLGDSLVRSLPSAAYVTADAAALEAWARVWQDVAERHPDLSLAARLFSVGVRYLQKEDERVLLDLVQEERSILRELFILDDCARES